MTLGTGLKSLGYGDEIAMRELQLRCHQIIPNANTQNIVKKYQELMHQLTKNDKKIKFYEDIDNIWERIHEESELLKGKCDNCPQRSILDYF
jgi:flagellar biosynthesis/type III secretory pathway chaperone